MSQTTHLAKTIMTTAHGVHQEEVSLFVSPGLHYDVILGMP